MLQKNIFFNKSKDSMKNPSIIDKTINEKIPCFFISPHLDDAIYSAGSLISYLANKVPVKIVTVFTHASPPPYTISAKRNLKICGYDNADQLFSDRRNEDKNVCRKLGIKYLHLGLTDALWRKKMHTNPLLDSIGKLIPEAIHLYPIYRRHVTSNNIAKGDFVIERLTQFLKNYIAKQKKIFLFCPLANDTHIDHIIVKRVCNELFDQLIYWLDYPYYLALNDNIRQKTTEMKLSNFSWPVAGAKDGLILSYKSQVAPTFPTGKIPKRPEYFFYKISS